MRSVATRIVLTLLLLTGSVPLEAEDHLPATPAVPTEAPLAPPPLPTPTESAETPTTTPDKPSSRAKPHRRKHQRCRAYAKPAYRAMVKRWLAAPKVKAPAWRDGYRELTIYAVNQGERISVFPFLANGELDPQAVETLTRLFRDKDTDATHPLEHRLIKLIYKLAVHFEARQIVLISGYREPMEAEGGGNHGRGRAADIVLSGVGLGRLAAKARTLGHVGVGLYPSSGFVHLDVREGPSYFWADRSGPGQASCLRRIGEKARTGDAKWKPEIDEPVAMRNKDGSLRGATASPAAAPLP